MKKLLWPALLLGLSLDASAQAGAPEDAWDRQPPRWGVGLAAVVSDSPYAGEGTRVMPVPMLSYQGERFYFRGISAGWRLWNNDALELSAVGKFRFDGFEVDDLGKRELARNGIDYRSLKDRDKSFDLGLAMKWSGHAGELEAQVLADATDTSGGQEVSLKYGYPIQLGKGMLTPDIGITWISKDMANYYYGTLDEEVARGVVDYKPGSVTIAHVGIGYFQPVGEKWSLMGFVKYSRLPGAIKNSPLIEPDTDGSVSMMVGISRGF
ncbi:MULTISPECIES: MipA/OmpV family protein [unclassified Lysobacter]|uniref:MipA/OmpV family protein n=1 Tax=unclassified Lysobacter TaxID=2635362 RepID=UPI001BEB9C06|nr:MULTISPECIES: MipA/OmpV family protein [unclassified Lysobacter]MBT2748746.1 MipA/OmpV family protein [Lysobacter sp. ISL-42]MBT2751681.1 MipA/OmpV family protein [Lysobacter sp. ISL-50]MBT2775875.1 MipA/OmpV family protein [Lysobacter sp. ISL-54]MBT2782161.1 MipA/OmpV family protein [Lysobacter sp. ISL-52]